MNRIQLDMVIDLVNSNITVCSCWCIEAEWENGPRILRLYIDKSGGVLLDDCVFVTNTLKDCSQLDDMVLGGFTLEVSSPGLSRPLRLLEHFSNVIGQIVKVSFVTQGTKKKSVRGKLLLVSSDGVLTINDSSEDWKIPLSDVVKANVIL